MEVTTKTDYCYGSNTIKELILEKVFTSTTTTILFQFFTVFLKCLLIVSMKKVQGRFC